jgi:hypothetical protein
VPALLQAFARLVALKRLGVLLFVLAATLCASCNASAIEPTQTKTRVWGFDFAEHNSDGLLRVATSGKYPGNRVAQGELASGSLLAAEGVEAAESTVLYRGFGPNELRSVQEAGKYAAKIGGTEGKYFFKTPEQVSNFARMMGDKAYTTTSVEVSASELAGGHAISPAGEGAGYFFPAGQLPAGPVTIWDFSVLP